MKKKAQSAIVMYNHVPAGTLEKQGNQYYFTYLPVYKGRPVSITMPVRTAPYESRNLFPVFINLLSEGANKRLQSRLLKIAGDDYFNLLLATAQTETIGPITIAPVTPPLL